MTRYILMWCVYGFCNLWGHRANVWRCNAEKPSTTKLVKYFICINRVLLKIMRGAAAQFRNKFSLVMPRYLIITIIIIAISNLTHSLPRPPHTSLSISILGWLFPIQIEIAMQCCNAYIFLTKIVWGFHPRYVCTYTIRAMQFCTDWILLKIHANFITYLYA